jgi:hypothetical protein
MPILVKVATDNGVKEVYQFPIVPTPGQSQEDLRAIVDRRCKRELWEPQGKE